LWYTIGSKGKKGSMGLDSELELNRSC
jgi:hypothetical protein